MQPFQQDPQMSARGCPLVLGGPLGDLLNAPVGNGRAKGNGIGSSRVMCIYRAGTNTSAHNESFQTVRQLTPNDHPWMYYIPAD